MSLKYVYQGKKGDRIIYRQYYQHSNTDTLKQFYISLVRPHLKYAAAVWDSYLHKDINKLDLTFPLLLLVLIEVLLCTCVAMSFFSEITDTVF